MSPFIAYPWAALLIAGAFALLALRRKEARPAVAAALWCVYGAYEYGMHARVLCSGECNIRVDLLLIYPLLLVLSVSALIRRRHPPAE